MWLVGNEGPVRGLTSSTAATVDESNLAQQLPDTYPAYKWSTKVLVAFVF
jgi:hypothetical protein